MIDPIKSALEVWLAFYNNLPPSITALINLSLFFFIFLVLFKIFYHIR